MTRVAKLSIGFFGCLLAAFLLCIGGGFKAYANPVGYLNDPHQAPASGVSYFDLVHAPMTYSQSSDIATSVSGDNWRCWSVGANYHGEGWFEITFTRAGYDWQGRAFDVVIKGFNIDNYGPVGSSNWPEAAAGTVFGVSLSSNPVQFYFCDNTSGWHAGSRTEMDLTITLRYSDTHAIVPYGANLFIDDLDINWPGDYACRESITLKSGLTGTVYVRSSAAGGNGLNEEKIRTNNVVESRLTTDCNLDFHCGFVTQMDTGTATMRWMGHNCGTRWQLAAVSYPSSLIQTPVKTVDDKIHFEGDTVTWKVDTFWPYSNSTNRPSAFAMTDKLDASLDSSTVSIKVLKNGTTDVSSQWTRHLNGAGSWCAHTSSIPMGKYVFEISAKLKKGLTFDGYGEANLTDGGSCYLVPNKAVVGAGSSDMSLSTTKTSNTVNAKVAWGWVEVNLGSANDSVSQLGQNDCYKLKGAQVGIYSDEACTRLVGTLTLDENGYGKSGRLPLGNYYIGEIKAPTGFASNGLIDSVTVKGLLITEDHRENVPQSEDLDGSIISKRDTELESIGERLNKWLQQWIDQ